MVRMSSPVEGRTSSEYGQRDGGFHAGLDIATGGVVRDVHATFAGKIVKIVRGRKLGDKSRVNELAPYRTGNGVIIQNPDGEKQLYGHVDVLDSLKVGQSVVVGQLLGKTDLSGNMKGSAKPYHVHYEEWTKNGATRNPRASFDAFNVKPGARPVKAKTPAAKVSRYRAKQNVNVRKGAPGIKSPIVRVLRKGETFTVPKGSGTVSKDGHRWFRTTSGNYVAAEYVEKVK